MWKLRDIHCVDLDDGEFKETIENDLKNLESPMEAFVFCMFLDDQTFQQAAWKQKRPPGLAQNHSKKLKRATLGGPRPWIAATIPRDDPQERRKNKNCGGRWRSATFWASLPLAPHSSGPRPPPGINFGPTQKPSKNWFESNQPKWSWAPLFWA